MSIATKPVPIPYAEWLDEARRLFGDDSRRWRFVCPVCKHVASVQDWHDAKAPESAIAFSCVGRWAGAKRDAFGLNAEKVKRGDLPPAEGNGPCNYAGGGLFALNPVKVDRDGEVHSMFAFATPEGAGPMESWRLVWRRGFAPTLPTAGLEALAVALRDDDIRIHQGATTTPPPLLCVQDWPCEKADAIAFCGWQGHRLRTVGQVEEFYAKALHDADERYGELAACRWFLNWFDDTPRAEMRRELLAEVEAELLARKSA